MSSSAIAAQMHTVGRTVKSQADVVRALKKGLTLCYHNHEGERDSGRTGPVREP